MELNREKLKRMFEDTKGNGGSANGGGGGGSLAGYATQAWVNEGFVSIDFFNRLFTVYGPGETSSDPDVVIEPNDLDSTIKNIKAMFGLWTEQYLSALGLNPGGTGSATSLSMLDDVDITTPANGQALVYNSTSLKWENQTIQVGGDYLPLTGGTLTNTSNDVLLTLSVPYYTTSWMAWIPSDGTSRYLGVDTSNNLKFQYTGASYNVLHTGNVKTINGESIFGSGNITIGGGGTFDLNYLMRDPWDTTVYDSNMTFRSFNDSTEVGIGLRKKSNRKMVFWGRYDTRGYICLHEGTGTTPLYWYFYPDGKLEIPGMVTAVGGIITETLTTHFVKINTGSYIANRAVLMLNSNTYAAADIVFTCNQSSTGNYGQWAISKRGSAENYRFSIWRGALNPAISSEKELFKIEASGNTTIEGSLYATGSITALSDVRQKNIVEQEVQLGFNDVVNAPIIKFTWKDPEVCDRGLQVGSIAQYWEKVLPEAVKRDEEGKLSMSYGVVALVAAVSTAKKVQEHERRIADLERENKELKVRLRRLNRYGEQQR